MLKGVTFVAERELRVSFSKAKERERKNLKELPSRPPRASVLNMGVIQNLRSAK
jgi:hypothetical protein